MDVQEFITHALSGYGVILRDGSLERVSTVAPRRVFSYKRAKKIEPEENVRTIIAYIESYSTTYGIRHAHLAALVLIDALKLKELLSAMLIVETYKNVGILNTLLESSYSVFSKLSVSQQKQYVDFVLNIDPSGNKRNTFTTSYLLQNTVQNTTQHASIMEV